MAMELQIPIAFYFADVLAIVEVETDSFRSLKIPNSCKHVVEVFLVVSRRGA